MPHIVTAYATDLSALKETVTRTGRLAEAQLRDAIDCLARLDEEGARGVIARDAEVDRGEEDVEARALRLLALRQPMAGDLRRVIGAFRIAHEFERIADYAANLAKRTIALGQLSAAPRDVAGVCAFGREVADAVGRVVGAVETRDVPAALAVWHDDARLDGLYNALFEGQIERMLGDPRQITPAIHLLFAAKNLERIGDHATNVAETLHFLVVGETIQAPRPKDDGLLATP